VALTKARQLVENDKASVLMGFTFTPECSAVAEYLKQVQIPMLITDNCGSQTLTSNPQSASPYVIRLTFASFQQTGPLADWGYKQGYRKAILLTSDYGGGLEIGDMAAATFVRAGGTIVQELHPALGSTDFGPFLAQLDSSADTMFGFTPGIDGLRLMDQYGSYASQRKLQILDPAGVLARGANLAALKDKAVGIDAIDTYTQALDTPPNMALLKVFRDKYPGRVISSDIVNGYVGVQALEAALKKVNGQIEQKQPFLDALHATDTDTAKGPIKLDKYHDVVQNMYVYQIVKQGNEFGHKLLQTYPAVTQFWDRDPGEVLRSQFGKLKGKWVGMTKDKLEQALQQG